MMDILTLINIIMFIVIGLFCLLLGTLAVWYLRDQYERHHIDKEDQGGV
jgi:multisubunit Na+/H+ antiporter MnhG subunit